MATAEKRTSSWSCWGRTLGPTKTKNCVGAMWEGCPEQKSWWSRGIAFIQTFLGRGVRRTHQQTSSKALTDFNLYGGWQGRATPNQPCLEPSARTQLCCLPRGLHSTWGAPVGALHETRRFGFLSLTNGFYLMHVVSESSSDIQM